MTGLPTVHDNCGDMLFVFGGVSLSESALCRDVFTRFFLFSLVVLNILSTMLLQLKSETVTNRPNEERCFVALCSSLRFTPSDSHRQTSAGSAAVRILNCLKTHIYYFKQFSLCFFYLAALRDARHT